MRLICPNCGAQYEVDGDLIPDEGCDVQCSNCGHAWFESAAAPSALMEDPEPSPPEPEPEQEQAPDDAPAPEQPVTRPDPPAAPVRTAAKAEPDTRPEGHGRTGSPVGPAVRRPSPVEEPEPAVPPVRPQARTPLDPSIADILREEAAREEAARRSEGSGGLEQQHDLGLRDPEPARPATTPTAVRRVETAPRDPRPEPVAVAVAPAPETGRRRELFPDIEEINSTLRSSAERDALPLRHAEQVKARKSGRRGFFGTLAVIVALALIYIFAEDIAASVPALADPLTSYVATVNEGRLWLDAQVQSLLAASDTGA
ncbi:MJ0042 family finger-like domain-containing protein [Loktanella atrilutea]|uniref:MJ0042 family finger-like domain-containing protein n=1 Tax=Loktanella atrilutea TaxID=366533 RepID=A0A1M5CSY9_LOKAT|nr:zinc-ribbon domain-containing protein [Loktanella atrilutea]SHF57873.1 MJ0042 family finger-like domain-containing protein [Loktanella atrilutea]